MGLNNSNKIIVTYPPNPNSKLMSYRSKSKSFFGSMQREVGKLVFGRAHLMNDDSVQSVTVKYRVELVLGEGNSFTSPAHVNSVSTHLSTEIATFIYFSFFWCFDHGTILY